ncbi:hypothetical protein QVA66_02640 [Staphylococcus chromogenes]|nr:hypothetical protein [Staphylococcus chromogenes]
MRPHVQPAPRRRQALHSLVAPFCVTAFLLSAPGYIEAALTELRSHDAPAVVRAVTGPAAEQPRADDRVEFSDYENFVANPTGSQISFTRLSDGYHTGSATERYPRPALSLSKLFIADYVLDHGTPEEREQALAMIRSSDDDFADELYEKYPDSITSVATEYGLWSTRASEDGWGYSVTSMYDMVKYLKAKIENEPRSPLLQAMKQADRTAADGYTQDFGTSVLPGAAGTKWGWSNDLLLHSSISFGDDYVVAVAVMGSAEDLTALVKHRVEPLLAGK